MISLEFCVQFNIVIKNTLIDSMMNYSNCAQLASCFITKYLNMLCFLKQSHVSGWANFCKIHCLVSSTM